MIALHPMYGSDSQKDCITLLNDYLTERGWKVFIDNYKANDLKNEKTLKKPWEFDNFYSNYENVHKCNLYAILESGLPGKTLILNGHIDVDIINKKNIINNILPIISDDMLYGRGAADMICGLCSLTTIKSFLDTIKWNGKIIFTAVVDEEIGGNGSLRACEWLKDNNYLNENVECVIAEPTECEITYETLGFLPFKISINSECRHMNTVGQKNIYEIKNIIDKLCELQSLYEDINVNLGYMQGGTDASLPMKELNFEGVIATTVSHNNDCIIDYLKIFSNKVYFPQMAIPAVKFETNKFGNEHFTRKIFNSSCDSSIFRDFNIPTTVFGPGSLKNAHCETECISLFEIKKYLFKLYSYTKEFFDYEQ